MLGKIKKFIKYKSSMIDKIEELTAAIPNDLKNPKVNLGQIQAAMNNQKNSISSLHEVEFQVYSQWGDDGIIQYLTSKIAIPNKVFVEFGVENYKESNTRFLLINNNWSGLVIDGSKYNIDYVKRDVISWAYDIHAKHAFITKENINELLSEFLQKGYPSEIGILSIDIDGNDYWVWDKINVVNPIIVIVEYNAVFGKEKPWTIPYASDFYRTAVHKSHQYWGASLKALVGLANKKGYSFIGCNTNANNAYFIRNDKVGQFKVLTPEEGFVDSKFREYVDETGERVGGAKRLELIRGMKIFNTETNQIEII